MNLPLGDHQVADPWAPAFVGSPTALICAGCFLITIRIHRVSLPKLCLYLRAAGGLRQVSDSTHVSRAADSPALVALIVSEV